MQASGLGMRLGRCSRPVKGVGLTTVPDARLDTARRVEGPPAPGVFRLLVPGMAVGEYTDCRCVADGVEVTGCLICARPE